MQPQLPSRHYPKVPLWRRAAAAGIDFFAVGLVSSFLSTGAIAQLTVFVFAWLVMRVVVVSKNRGQSLGRWALDMRVYDPIRNTTPDLLTLTKREGILGVAAALAFLGLANLSPTGAWAILLFLPLGLDCSLAYMDEDLQRAFHDQYAGTIVVQTRRGYSLDVKIKKLVADVRQRMKK